MMKLTAVLFTTLLITVSSRAQVCTPIHGCGVTINDSCYAYVDQQLNWNDAEDCCIEWGGHLASIHSTGVNYLLNSIRSRDRITWIGLNDIASEGNFVWSDGSSYDYDNFNHVNPSNSRGNEDCVHFYSNALEWNDYRCDGLGWNNPTSYICQKRYVITIKGEPGEPGRIGEPGIDGRHGNNGLNGEPGNNGINGEPGNNGINGEPGNNGINGEQGNSGLNGEPGNNGLNGEQGNSGLNGQPGPQGERGDRGYPAVYATSKGTQEPVGTPNCECQAPNK